MELFDAMIDGTCAGQTQLRTHQLQLAFPLANGMESLVAAEKQIREWLGCDLPSSPSGNKSASASGRYDWQVL